MWKSTKVHKPSPKYPCSKQDLLLMCSTEDLDGDNRAKYRYIESMTDHKVCHPAVFLEYDVKF